MPREREIAGALSEGLNCLSNMAETLRHNAGPRPLPHDAWATELHAMEQALRAIASNEVTSSLVVAPKDLERIQRLRSLLLEETVSPTATEELQSLAETILQSFGLSSPAKQPPSTGQASHDTSRLNSNRMSPPMNPIEETCTLPEMKDDPSRLAAARARDISNAFNLLALLASPKICARLHAQGVALPSPSHMGEHLEALMNALKGSTFGVEPLKSGEDMIPTLREVHQLVLKGDGKTVSPELQEGARRALRAMDFPDPPGGWDLFEGPEERKK